MDLRMAARFVACSAAFTAVAASRVGSSKLSSDALEAEGALEGSEGKGWSPWELKFEGLSCLSPEFSPFSKLEQGWPKCVQKAREQATKLGTSANCRVCDVDFSGSKPEKDQSMTSTGCKATVHCAAGRLSPKEACFENNGKVGAVQNLNSNEGERAKYPGRECLPCSEGCKDCIFDKSWTSWGTGKVQYKCIMDPTGTAETGARCVLPTDVECGECSNRKCGGVMPKWGCKTSQFKSICKFPASYNLPASDTVDPAKRDYTLTVKSGYDSSALPPVLGELS